MAAGSGPFSLRTICGVAVFWVAAIALPGRAGVADEWRRVEEPEQPAVSLPGRPLLPATSNMATPRAAEEDRPRPSAIPDGAAARGPTAGAAVSAPAARETPTPSTRTFPPALSVAAPTAGEPLAALPGAAEIGRLALATCLVVAIGAVGLGAYRHLRWGAAGRRPTQPGLTWHASISLGALNGLHLVSVTDRRFLVAVDARGVSCITPISSAFDELTLSEEDLAAAVCAERPARGGSPAQGRA
jgi:flagellar biogenesis protein FliO